MNRVAILPALCTLGNALAGLAAVTFTWKAVVGEHANPLAPRDVLIAGYCVILGMVFDALDGRLARAARATSGFGGQLDSLADAITFGLAPAFLMNRVVVEPLRGSMPDALEPVLMVTWVCAAVYLSCALIRLARFNVENVEDEEAHQWFRGLPSPAAAGALVSVVIVVATFWQDQTYPRLGTVVLCIMPLVAVVLGVLMVSSVRYVHLLNFVIRGRRPINHLVGTVLAIAVGILILWLLGHAVGLVLGFAIGLVLGFGGYALSGPVGWVIRRSWRPAATSDTAEWSSEGGPSGLSSEGPPPEEPLAEADGS